VLCHKRGYTRTSLQTAEIAACKRLEGEVSHVAGGYSKLCPGFRASTSIVTWWLTTPTKATRYLLSQIRNDFFWVLFVMCFCYFYCCIKALTKAAPKSRRIIGATFQLLGDSLFLWFSFIQFLLFFSSTVILFFPCPLYLFTFFLYYFVFSSAFSGVPRGWFGGSNPPEIPKFWQSWAEFPVPWKIHP
jgi:hypothetical protein